MSGDSEIPPTYYFSGITFNPSFYQSSSSDYLTLATAKSSFLTYPTAQGTETITTLTSTTINSSSVASDLSIVPSQTSGDLYIGTGARTTAGAISIGTGSSVANPITIGSASSVTNINGVGTIYANTFDSLSAGTNTTFLDSITSGSIDIGKFQVGGVFELANGARTASISIGNNATAGTLTLGAAANANTRILGGTISIGYNQGTNTIDIGNEQTSGDINIGVGSGRLTTGSINICSTNTGAGVVVPIKIGNTTSATAMNGTCTFSKQINATLGLTSAGDIATTGTATITAPTSGSLIGPYKNAATATASITTAGAITGTSLVLGTGAITSCGSITASGLITADGGLQLNAGDLITANGGLTIGGAYGITLTTTSYAPTSTQLGYIGRAFNNAIVNYSTGATGTDIVNTGTVLAIGIYQMNWTISVNNWTNGTAAYMNFSFNTSGGISINGVPQTSGAIPPTTGSDYIMQLQGVTNSATQFATFNFSCIVKSTSASQEINFRGKINTGTNTATTPTGYGQVTWIKIA